ncbi:MAG TPA: D-alanyl-D-alanine carboxypeptidase [Leptolyngbyaceae cyanobacterium M33_DOE_097]|uniref:D-alanyl-D-alanine carboxypeptidase n=1 Tax=Oscillatoriales cyanobacterium SpSt-418 TaxID=2282169 RepID=A0A7C3PH27_9CYAN|nr:D-alanyl-D-alanine carboxypeptidase [Leptolyngbyaceae cyanobacterium M33_DOE_097]
MLDLLSSGVISFMLNQAQMPELANSADLVVWQPPVPVFVKDADPTAQAALLSTLQTLSGQGLNTQEQGIWLQQGSMMLAQNQGTTPFPAASLTKVATSLASLYTFGPNHQFETLVSATGPIYNGVLQGDLIVQGGGDPLLVWEDAIAIGNALNQLGIRQVTGNLLVTGNFMMNFESDRFKSGNLLKQALNQSLWSGEVEAQYRTLPKGTARPQVEITGLVSHVGYGSDLLPASTVLLRQKSLPVKQIIKLMNIYSNNAISEAMANAVGGPAVVAERAAQLANVPQQEVLLKNGSGLGVENRISPRAVCAMFATLQRYAETSGMTLADFFPISGTDEGTIETRKIPRYAVVKTGTLNDVSALAGVLPTRDRGLVWFAILNRGSNLDGLRGRQDALLQALSAQWGVANPVPVAVRPTASVHSVVGFVGDNRRIQTAQAAAENYWFRQ